MQKFSYHQNMDISDEDDDDYPPTITKPRKAREFIVKDAPQAVVEWYMISLDKKAAIKKSEVKEHALGHLLAMGWEFFYIQKKTREELRYKAPNGRVYISLRMACKAYMEEQGVVVSDQMTQMNDSQPEKETPSEQDLGNEKPQPRKAAKGTSPRNPPTTDLSVHYNVASKPEKQTRPSSFEELKSPVLPEKQIPPEKGTPASSFENPKDEYELVKSPVLQSEQDLRNKKPQPRKAAKGTSRRNQRTALSYLMDHELISPGDRVHCNVTRDGRLVTWRGSITNEGFIKCDCCSNLFPISKFEAHTGSTKHRPAANIFLEDGRSLLDCQKQLVQNTDQTQKETKATEKKVNHNDNADSDTHCPDKNDCICSLCHFGGELILCDLCPAAFHGSCLGIKGIPSGNWYCPSCCCKICGQVSYDFDDQVSSFDTSFVKCVQCEQNVHIGCVKSIQVLEGSNQITIDRENWFCTRRCEDIHMGLQNLLWKQIPVGDARENLTWTLMKYCPYKVSEHNRKKLNEALGVMHKSFRPVKDPITKNDLIEDVFLSKRSESKRLNFEGFYTVVLERKNTVVSVATVRVYGDEVAEIPLVATRLKYRRHGMCRRLMDELEHQLVEMGVKRLTLPAVPEALKTWTKGFGFTQMTDSDRLELIKYIFLGFQHTVRCQKDLLEKISVSNHKKWWANKKLKHTWCV
ncbi:increased DNA methylation 1-like [Cucumis melo var. makuwa]|uniref:Increased DNA methylation 1-like n=1 Tax=Cucumis melo var. makuwa TaxID=1194695 RepID=A0A5D3D9F4_CUCMM|nr:increased DNA methylation 1-like [Cucumis melo var. makuwa]TYK20144.1 increased DNA methylation 1-like [Cucumis melo var. makuwa]